MQHFSETFYNVPVQLLLLYLNVSHKDTEKQVEFSIKDFLDFPADLVTFIEKSLMGNFIFCSVRDYCIWTATVFYSPTRAIYLCHCFPKKSTRILTITKNFKIMDMKKFSYNLRSVVTHWKKENKKVTYYGLQSNVWFWIFETWYEKMVPETYQAMGNRCISFLTIEILIA